MRVIGEQWIENGRMYKAVPQESKIIGGILYGNICHECCHIDKWDDDCLHFDQMCPVEKGLIVKDLGPVNEEGLLACPFCGSNLNIVSCHDGFYARCCNNDCALGVTASFVEKQDLIDACNRRN